MRYSKIDSQLFVKNRERLQALLSEGALVILHANDVMPSNADGTMPFRQNSNLFYLTGVDQEETVLMLFPDAPEERDREILFVRRTSETIAVWEGDKLSKEGATGVSGVQRVEWTESFDAHLHRLIPQAKEIFLDTNEHVRADTIVETRNARFIVECQARYPLHRYQRLAPLMHQLRIIKDPREVDLLQKAIDITEAGFRRALGFIKPGVGEWEVEAEYLHEFVRRGSRGFAYSPIVGSGKNACVLHYLESKNFCQDGEMILMDVGAEWMNWNADMTRTVPVNGRFTGRQRDVYNAVLRVFRESSAFLRPGVKPSQWRDATIAMMEAELIGLGLIDASEARAQKAGSNALVSKYYMHGIGHHLGLDVHDVSPPEEPIQEGMVFTVEPGIYVREEGLGVRIENDIVIGKDKNHDLFENVPVEVEEIEDLMNGG